VILMKLHTLFFLLFSDHRRGAGEQDPANAVTADDLPSREACKSPLYLARSLAPKFLCLGRRADRARRLSASGEESHDILLESCRDACSGYLARTLDARLPRLIGRQAVQPSCRASITHQSCPSWRRRNSRRRRGYRRAWTSEAACPAPSHPEIALAVPIDLYRPHDALPC